MRVKSKIFIFFGVLLLLASLGLALFNAFEENEAEQAAGYLAKQLELREEADNRTLPDIGEDTAAEEDALEAQTIEENIPDYVLNPDMEMPKKEIDGYDYIGVIEIPSLNLTLPVMAQWSYPGLKISPGRFTGSVYTRDIVIAAHNYSSHFGKIKNLLQGDKVIFTDIDGNRFIYRVLGTEILEKKDVYYMITGEWDLTIFTCTKGGRRRVSVRCELITEEAQQTK